MSSCFSRRASRTLKLVSLLAAWGLYGSVQAEPVVGPKITWDRAANIRDAAERIGKIQRTQGADGAIKFIDACYRTHGLAENYSAAFEGCIAQDYLETKLLARIYSRLPAETLKKLGAPTADALAQAMGRRVVAAFKQYKVTAAQAEAFKTEVDTHGLEVFLKIVFPNMKSEGNDGPAPDPAGEAIDPGAGPDGAAGEDTDNGKDEGQN